MIRLENVGFQGDGGAFRNLDFHLAEGTVAVILGRRNAGKSDFIHLCLGRLPASSGNVQLLGRPIDPNRFAGGVEVRRIGYVSQHITLLDNLTVANNVGLPLSYHQGLEPAALRARVMAVLEPLGIAAVADRFPHKIDNNQAKLAMLARAIILNPSLLVLDEPTAGDLDPVGFLAVLEAIQRFRRQGTTMLITTCSPSLAALDGADVYALLDRRLYPHSARLPADDPCAQAFFGEIRGYAARHQQEIERFRQSLFPEDGATEQKPPR